MSTGISYSGIEQNSLEFIFDHLKSRLTHRLREKKASKIPSIWLSSTGFLKK